MGDSASDSAVLAGGRGVWSATPWNYSSLRSLWLTDGGSGELIYGYGQTIYAQRQLPVGSRGSRAARSDLPGIAAVPAVPGVYPTRRHAGEGAGVCAD